MSGGLPPAAQGELAPAFDCRRSILVIDDDPDIREVVAVALAAEGYQVAGCGNGREALNHLRSHVGVGIILLDLMLPGMTATQFRAAQTRDRSLAWIPIIVMSGASDAARDAVRLGARAFVRKPVDLDQLRAAVEQVGGLRTRLQLGARRSFDG
jgi:DNA-binding NtrC family response regulator